jgi:hypothetical protein
MRAIGRGEAEPLDLVSDVTDRLPRNPTQQGNGWRNSLRDAALRGDVACRVPKAPLALLVDPGEMPLPSAVEGQACRVTEKHLVAAPMLLT